MSQIAFPPPDPCDPRPRARRSWAGLAAPLLPDGMRRRRRGAAARAFETDALTAYRRLPLAVVLPRIDRGGRDACCKFCREAGVNVVPRGAGTSLAGGAIPQEDAIVIGLSKMSRILEINLADRYARVEAGVTNLAISEAVVAEGFFYAPDPSSQLACTIGGNIGDEFGRRALPEIWRDDQQCARRAPRDRSTARSSISAARTRCGGLDLLGLVVGSEGQLGIVTEATVRLLRVAEGARPVLFGFDFARGRRRDASPRSSAPASFRSRWNIWTSSRSRSARISPMPAIPSTSRRC